MIRLLLILLAAIAATPLKAASVYNDLSSFMSVLEPGYHLETFATVPMGLAGASMNLPGGYTVSAMGDLWGQDYAGSRVLSTNSPVQALQFTFTTLMPTAVGGYFFPTDESGALLDGPVTVDLSDGTHVVLQSNGTTPFLGFTTGGGTVITSLLIWGSITSDVNYWPTVENLYVGRNAYPDGSATPEPSTLLPGGMAALAGLVLVRRRRATWPRSA